MWFVKTKIALGDGTWLWHLIFAYIGKSSDTKAGKWSQEKQNYQDGLRIKAINSKDESSKICTISVDVQLKFNPFTETRALQGQF